ncbi:protein MIS12 homolog [Mangifera indica]|uniref:protein MIS12 homolog n=1 Tax=Mangifera indica TaxID=29780 RepID=UPI001CFAC707|nr:protein MIS12 homolog [Mangifera indica]
MEVSESEAVFNSLNLNPQIFINEALNAVDDLVDDAFEFHLQQDSTLLKTKGTDRSQDLSKVRYSAQFFWITPYLFIYFLNFIQYLDFLKMIVWLHADYSGLCGPFIILLGCGLHLQYDSISLGCLDMWEKYCLHHCFAVPEGFSLPKTVSFINRIWLVIGILQIKS